MTDSSTRAGMSSGDDTPASHQGLSPKPPTTRHRRHVLAGYRVRTIATDVLAVIAGSAIALLVKRDIGVELPALVLVLVALWLVALAGCGTYLDRVLAVGPEEYRRVLVAGGWVFALAVTFTFVADADLSRAYLFTALGLGLLLCLLGRWLGRLWLVRRRKAGRLLVQSLLIGDAHSIDAVVAMMTGDRYAGYSPAARLDTTSDGRGSELLMAEIESLIAASDIGAVVISAGAGIDAGLVSVLACHLEGSEIDLFMTPDLAAIASPRRTFAPANGLPLMRCDEAALTPIQNAAKRSVDLVGAIVGLVLLGLPMLLIGAAVRLTSDGPALFRQLRAGRDGRPFQILKYRTMTKGSEDLRDGLRLEVGHDEPAFKLRDDPRVTPLGRFLRRWSLDELPQLINVLRGDMTLVGPRPHPLDDVTRYRNEDHRRLLVRPGMTGLWQVAGRSSLPWGDGVKLDLYYIETWSLAGDLVLLARTVKAVLSGHGAS